MKIDRYRPVQPYSGNYSSAKAGEQTPQSATNDKVEISSTAKRMQGSQALEKAREEKIDQVREQIANGSYSVPAKNIAEKMYTFWNRQ